MSGREQMQVAARKGWLRIGLLSLVTLCLSSWPASCAYNCDIFCQQAQRSALLKFYENTNGHLWSNGSVGEGPLEAWGSEESDDSDDGRLPSHCSWSGVICCDTNGYLALDQRIEASVLGPSYSGLGCSSPSGVILIALPYAKLSGTLPGMAGTWSPFAKTLQLLDLTGARQPASFAAHNHSMP